MKKTRSKRNRTTMRNVAARAGVSVMTVSNVVNGRSKSVGAETRERILKLIDEMNYRPVRAGAKP